MKITAFGAAEEVTGTKHILEINGHKILLDCGMFQGHRQESDKKNRHLGFSATDIDAVVLSHAHIDHSGLLPLLGKLGYRGAVHTTPATRDLCSIMLLDSAHIQKRDAEWLSKKHLSFVAPLYRDEDVQEIMRRFISISYELRFQLLPGIFITFHDAGHVLGSAMVEIEYEENGKWRRFIFSADIGRRGMSILRDPWEPRDADVVMMESTYWDRDHGNMQEMEEKLAAVIHESVARRGKIIIPCFALERAQEIIFAIKRLELRNAIPPMPVYVDSPLTVNITDIFRLHTEAFDDDFSATMREAGDPFQLNRIRYIRPVSESMELNSLEGPAIIISASGMCETGRVIHHIKNHCEDPNTTILIVGFQAQHTLGRRIVEHQRRIRVFGVERDLNAQVKVMNEFSAHAGRTELIAFAKRFKGRAEKILIVHGELPAMQSLKGALETEGMHGIHIMRYAETVEV